VTGSADHRSKLKTTKLQQAYKFLYFVAHLKEILSAPMTPHLTRQKTRPKRTLNQVMLMFVCNRFQQTKEQQSMMLQHRQTPEMNKVASEPEVIISRFLL
jgi:hypothetical protein